MPESIFESLIFQAMPMGEPLPKWPPQLTVQMPTSVSGVAQGPNAPTFMQAAPLFARRSPMTNGDVNWPVFCGLLRELGISLQTSFSEVESLSDANVPLRTLRRGYDEGFDLVDLSSADTVLLDCVVAAAGQKFSRLPLETAAWHELKQLIEGLRQIVGFNTPIGLAMSAGDIYTDVSNALAARVDYVVLEFAEMSSQTAVALNHLVWSVVAARNACAHSGSPSFPIFIDAPLTNVDHLIKLLALGATAICIDAVAASATPVEPPPSLQVPKGLLSGIGSLPAKSSANVQPIAAKINELLARIRQRVFQQQLSSLHMLGRDHLRALDERAARLCCVKMLEHE